MTDKEKIIDILLEFYEEYQGNIPNRPMIPNIYASKIIDTLQEEPVNEDLEETAENAIEDLEQKLTNVTFDEVVRNWLRCMFRAGAQWQKEVFEKNRLAACDRATKEEIEREQDFVDKVLIGEQRQPTFSDAIEYGIKWQKNYVWHDAKKEKPERMEPLLIDDGVQFVIGDKTCIEETDKWCYITDILPNKED